MKDFSSFIDGRLNIPNQQTIGEQSASQIKFNPRTGEPEFRFFQAGFMDVVQAVKSAHGRQKKWQEMPSENRKILLEKFSHLILLNRQNLVSLDSSDSGIPESDAGELFDLAHQRLVRILQMASPELETSVMSEKEYHIKTPVGLVGLILDDQQALLNICENLAAALACKNLVLLYPSESSIRISLKLAELAVEAGLPGGVLNVLLGRGKQLAENILEHPAIKYIRFYGDNELGEKLGKLAAENNKRLFMSLGANNAAIAFADCNLQSSVAEILALALRFHFYGRNKINRILVQEKILKEFKLELKNQFDHFSLELGPLHNETEKANFGSYILHSKKDRAKVFLGDSEQSLASAGYRVAPIIYEDLTNCSTLHQESLHGPILFLQSFKYAHELGKILNSGAYAYRVYIWTEDPSRKHKLVQQIEVSEIFFNSSQAVQAELAHSSLKNSGFGEEGIEALFDFNLHKKLVHQHS